MIKYYVLSRFYNNGKVTAQILLESEYEGQQNEETDKYDQYVDVFDSFEKAEEFYKDCLIA